MRKKIYKRAHGENKAQTHNLCVHEYWTSLFFSLSLSIYLFVVRLSTHKKFMRFARRIVQPNTLKRVMVMWSVERQLREKTHWNAPAHAHIMFMSNIQIINCSRRSCVLSLSFALFFLRYFRVYRRWCQRCYLPLQQHTCTRHSFRPNATHKKKQSMEISIFEPANNESYGQKPAEILFTLFFIYNFVGKCFVHFLLVSFGLST